ncbi:MAG: replicative DNA helicase [Solobacterium sp.]|nr:replicative DNA helicase [Solobacterium sp.]
MPAGMMPAAPEAEASLLGTMMLYPSSARIALEEGLSEEDFFQEANRKIFLAVESLYREGTHVDLTTVVTRLRDRNQLDAVGGFEYLSALSEAAVTSANTKDYVELVHEKAVMRKMIEAAQQIMQDGFEGQSDVDGYLDGAEKAVLEISRGRRTAPFLTPDEVFSSVLNKVRKMSESGSTITGLGSGFRDFDRITHGFQRGDLVILAARPSMGKTAVALNMALQTADRNRNEGAVAIFSLEQPAEQIGMRLLSARSRVDGDHIKTGRLSNDEWTAVNDATVDLKNLNLYSEDSSTIKVPEMFSKCRQLQADKGLAMVVVDYLQLITGSSRGRDVNRQQEVSDISRSLKALARELNVPVLALSQLSRGVESRTDKRPMLSDLRESGAIEQDADIVLMLYREAYYNEEARTQAQENNSEQLEVIIAKHRNGETGRFFLAFEGATNACMNYAAPYSG